MLHFIGIDPGTNGDQCPAISIDPDAGEAGEIIIQGWIADKALLAAAKAHSPLSPGEAVVRVPARMISLVREACDALEHAHA